MGRLTATAIKAAREPGRYSDGEGLFLVVQPGGTKSWVVRVQKNKVRRDIGIGSLAKVPLALARERAREVRTQTEAGLDPVAERRRGAGVPTFRQAAAMVHAEQRSAWRNAKHAAQWMASLEKHAFPGIGDLGMDILGAAQVRDLLASIWLNTPETARRVRQRIYQIDEWAVAKGYRAAALPQAVINRALPKVPRGETHFAALHFDDVPGFLSELRARPEAPARLALELVILTASRSGEVRLADWSEIDLERGLWMRSAERMKMKRAHTVPLSPAAVAVLERAAVLTGEREGLVFEGQARGKPLSDMTLTKRLRDMKVKATVHGFRSSFRDWVSERTDFDGSVAEAALAHQVKDATEAAYRRGELLEKRRVMMNAWAAFCEGRT